MTCLYLCLLSVISCWMSAHAIDCLGHLHSLETIEEIILFQLSLFVFVNIMVCWLGSGSRWPLSCSWFQSGDSLWNAVVFFLAAFWPPQSMSMSIAGQLSSYQVSLTKLQTNFPFISHLIAQGQLFWLSSWRWQMLSQASEKPFASFDLVYHVALSVTF